MKFSDFKKNIKGYPLFGGDIVKMFSVSPQTMCNQLMRWKKRGLIIQLRKGLYTLSKEERMSITSKELIAASLYMPSYISLETALSYYKMIPERVVPVTSVTTRKTKTFQNEDGLFIYRHLKKSAYFGFKQMRDEFDFPYFLAEPEKALLDLIYLNLGSINLNDTDYFTTSLRLQNQSILNKKKLISDAKRYKIKKLMKIVEKLI